MGKDIAEEQSITLRLTAAEREYLLAYAAAHRLKSWTIEACDEQENHAMEFNLGSEYTNVELISTGGWAEVYRAYEQALKRSVALKTLKTDVRNIPGARERLQQEAQAQEKLKGHPCILPIYRFVEREDGKDFFVMRFVRGSNLDEWLNQERTPISFTLACEIVRTVANAVAYAHNEGVVHRDLKLSNILRDVGGRIFVTDFGIAKVLRPDGTQIHTEVGSPMGTPGYRDPQYAFSGKDDKKNNLSADEVIRLCDIYGLGAVLYKLLTGKTLPEHHIATQEELEAALPSRFVRIMRKCIDQDLSCRYESADQLTKALEPKPGIVATVKHTSQPLPDPLEEVFALLEKAWKTGRPTRPLFGAGISDYAGIPTAATLCEHLDQVQQFADEHKGSLSYVDYIEKQGWPERQAVNAWFSKNNRLGSSGEHDQDLNWNKKLIDLTQASRAFQIDFRQQLVLGRRPATCHQLIACLAKRMSWTVILTTNFDELIESALAQQNFAATVYSLSRPFDLAYRPIVQTGPIVFKLHGDVADFQRHDPIIAEDRARIFDRVPSDTIMLVLGYSGSDQRRVMGLIRSHCERAATSKHSGPSLVWIHRRREPPKNVRNLVDEFGDEAIKTARYQDAELFLQELFVRATSSHPVSVIPYRLLAQVPPKSEWVSPPSDVDLARVRNERVVVYHRESVPYGTSSALAANIRDLFQTHRVIWCDMEETPTVDALITYVQNEILSVDPDVPPFALYRNRRESTVDGSSFDSDPRISHLVEALQRDKYLLVVDSMGELGNSHIADPPLPARSDQINREHRRLLDFVLGLACRSNEFGQSKLFLAHTYLQIGDRISNRECANEFVSKLTTEFGAAEVTVDTQYVEAPFKEKLQNLVSPDALPMVPEESRSWSLEDWVPWLWKSLKSNDHRVVLAVASAFRRPRSLAALRKLCVPFLDSAGEIGDSSQFTDLFLETVSKQRTSVWTHNLLPKDRERLDDALHQLSAAGLVVRQEGGFYWMHRIVRNETYRCLMDASNSEDRHQIGDLHDLIAKYYYVEAFSHSNDPASFYEFVFHRLASIRDAEPIRCNHRLEDLARTLERHRDDLLTHGEAETLTSWVANIQDEMHKYRLQFTAPDSQSLISDLLGTLCDMEAEVRRQSGDLYGCIRVRLRQVQHRLLGYKGTPLAKEDLQRLNELAPETNSRTMASVGNELQAEVQSKWFVEMLEKLVGWGADRVQSPDTARNGLRLLGHILDTAVCMKSLREDTDRVADLLQNIQKSLANTENNKLASAELSTSRKLQAQCAFRLIDLWTAQVSPWHRDQKTVRRWIDDSRTQFKKGQGILQRYPGLADRDQSRMTCLLNTVGASVAYLQNQFSLAYQLLDNAQSAVQLPERPGSSRTSTGVCHLHRAEALILHADYQLCKKTKDKEGLGIELDVWGDAKGKLETARSELVQAHKLLLSGRPNTWWWTWLYYLYGQWCHEWFAVRLDAPDPTVWPTPHSPQRLLPPFQTPSQRYLRAPLHAIRDGLDCVGLDQRRRSEFHILWWQLFVCRLFEQLSFPEQFWTNNTSFHELWSSLGVEQQFEDWVDLNRDFGLQVFADQQRAQFSGDVAEWSKRDWEDVDELVSKRSNAYHNPCRSLRNVLLTVEAELLTPMVRVARDAEGAKTKA